MRAAPRPRQGLGGGSSLAAAGKGPPPGARLARSPHDTPPGEGSWLPRRLGAPRSCELTEREGAETRAPLLPRSVAGSHPQLSGGPSCPYPRPVVLVRARLGCCCGTAPAKPLLRAAALDFNSKIPPGVAKPRVNNAVAEQLQSCLLSQP